MAQVCGGEAIRVYAESIEVHLLVRFDVSVRRAFLCRIYRLSDVANSSIILSSERRFITGRRYKDTDDDRLLCQCLLLIRVLYRLQRERHG